MTLNSTEKQCAEKISTVSFVVPMKARLTEDYFSDKDWIYERKLDGVRTVIVKTGQQVTLFSRNKKEMNTTYPELVTALKKFQHKEFVADGEIVAFEGALTSFSRLQKRQQIKDPKQARSTGVAVYLYLFDLMIVDGFDLRKLPLGKRKVILKRELPFGSGEIRFLPHINQHGVAYRKQACEKGWEGVIAKDRQSAYQSSRTSKWLKFKCHQGQEFVIGGYTNPQGSRLGFGAILIGYYENDELIYAGKVGTGYDEATLQEMSDAFSALEVDDNPFASEIDESDVHWIKPELVAEVDFTEWTDANKLRHSRFKGLRQDKQPQEVIKELPS